MYRIIETIKAILISISFIACAGAIQAHAAPLNAADDAALTALYNTTGGATWTNNTGWSGTLGQMDNAVNPPFGVTFDAAGRVLTISLTFNNLTGDISALNWSGMTALTQLGLPNNRLSGTLPAAAQLPAGIQSISLWGNRLTGTVPDYSTLPALAKLNLYNNNLSGSLPTAAQLPATIQWLYLSTNRLTGTIPDYSTLPAMTILWLYNNQLSGSLPTAAQLPATIQQLYLFGNQLTGPIPDYSTLTSMTQLELGSNPLSATMPTAAQLPSGIQRLGLSSLQLTGTVPDYSTLTSMTILDLSQNQLSGSLPTVAQLPAAIQQLYLDGNQLTGSIPDYKTLTALFSLSLTNNQLSGNLPTVAQLPVSMKYFYLDSNQLTGTIPDYSTLPALMWLGLRNLNIQGPTPAGLLAWGGSAFFTSTPAIDPALDGSSNLPAPLTVTGTGGEPGGTVELLLDGTPIVTGIVVDGVGAWSGVIDLSGRAPGAHSLTATSRFDTWPGYAAGQGSTVPSTAVTVNVIAAPVPVASSGGCTISQKTEFDPTMMLMLLSAMLLLGKRKRA